MTENEPTTEYIVPSGDRTRKDTVWDYVAVGVIGVAAVVSVIPLLILFGSVNLLRTIVEDERRPGLFTMLVLKAFDVLFRFNLPGVGWQTVLVGIRNREE